MRVGVYAPVSTLGEQNPGNQLIELRRYCEARGWTVFREYIDKGVSGAKERRPALDELLKDAKRRRFDVLVCWRLDRLGRNQRHLILLLDDIHALGIGFVTLGEGIDTTSPSGRLILHILGAISRFERERIRERGSGDRALDLPRSTFPVALSGLPRRGACRRRRRQNGSRMGGLMLVGVQRERR